MARFSARRVFSARRRVVIIVGIIVVVGGAVGGGAAEAISGGHGSPRSSSGSGGPVATAPVVRTDLTTTQQVGGSISYDGSYVIAAPSGASSSQVSQAQQAVTADQQQLSVDGQAESDAVATSNQTIAADQSTAKAEEDQAQGRVGTDKVKLQGDQTTLSTDEATAINPGTAYTWLPTPGDVIKQDQPVYSVSNEPVPLLYGSIPAYRVFYAGMSDGGDVGELTHDLITLGYGDGLTQSSHYSSATVAAVKRWQKTLGLPTTGEILLGEVVFEPGPIRVTSVTPSAGASYGGSGGGGTVLTATSTTPIVTVDLPVTQEYLVKPGDGVSVVLPDGTSTVGGHVERVGSVATCPGGSGTGTGSSGGGGSADQSPCSSAGSGGSSGSNSPPTVTVTVSLDNTPPGATLDQAPVNVNITSQRANNVLAVPVNALLALAGGGFGVDVVTGSTIRLAGVTTGVYSSTMVQVSGSGITAGMRVEVPSS